MGSEVEYRNDKEEDTNRGVLGEVLPLEILYLIGVKLGYPDVMTLCQASSFYEDIICSSDAFWRQKSKYDFRISNEQYKNMKADTPEHKYLLGAFEAGEIYVGSENAGIGIYKLIRRAAQNNDSNLLRYFMGIGLKRGHRQNNLNVNALKGAAKGGHLELFQSLGQSILWSSFTDTHREAILNDLLYLAAEGGNRNIIDYTLNIDSFFTGEKWTVDTALTSPRNSFITPILILGSASGGHLDLFKFYLENIPHFSQAEQSVEILQDAYKLAAAKNRHSIVSYLHQLGINSH